MAITSDNTKPQGSLDLIVESWSQGFMLGALIIMLCITIANMRSGVLLHKLVMVELLIALPDCFFIFWEPPIFGWYLSTSSALMIASWTLHNIVAWFKNKPFLERRSSYAYIGTVIMVQPYWLLEIYANFGFFNNFNTTLFPKTRPFEAVCRDPWWIITTVNLFWNIKYRYGFGYLEVVRVSPRFGLMLLSMCISMIFIVVDIIAVTPALEIGGLNPFWKVAFVFKCLTDTIILDDFKTALDKLTAHKFRNLANANGPDPEARGSHQTALGTSIAGPVVNPERSEIMEENVGETKMNTIHVERQFGRTFAERVSVAGSSESSEAMVDGVHRSWK